MGCGLDMAMIAADKRCGAGGQKTSRDSSGEGAGRGMAAGEMGEVAIVGEERMGERESSWAA